MSAPLCTDCRHFNITAPTDGMRPICMRPIDWRPVMAVAIMPINQRPSCFEERTKQGVVKRCGPDGRFFEAKEAS